MNLGQILQQVGDELRYAPAVRAHREDLRRVVQRQWDALAESERWPFLVRETPLWAFPDLAIGNADVARVADHTLQVNAAAIEAAMYDELDAAAYNDLQRYLVGATVELDPTLRDQGAGNWEAAPFVVEHMAVGVGGPVTLHLDPTATISAWDGTEGSLLIRFPRILLPADTRTVLGIKTASGLPLRSATPAEVRRAWVQEPTNGTPAWFLEDGGHRRRFAPFVMPGLSAGVTPVNANQGNDVYSRENLTIRAPISAAVSAGGTLSASTRHRVFASVWYAGRFGPPSNVVEVTTTVGNRTIDVTGLPVMPASDYGRIVATFIAEGEGAFRLATFNLDPTVSTATIATYPGGGAALEAARWDAVWPGGPYQYLRLWPRPAAAERLVMEYEARPAALVEDTDTPSEIPEPYHHVLVWLVCMNLVGRDVDERFYLRVRENAREALGRLHAAYFGTGRYDIVKGQTVLAGAPGGHGAFLANFFAGGITLE